MPENTLSAAIREARSMGAWSETRRPCLIVGAAFHDGGPTVETTAPEQTLRIGRRQRKNRFLSQVVRVLEAARLHHPTRLFSFWRKCEKALL